MFIEKIYCNEFQKSSSQQHLFDVSLFNFHFVSALQYLDCYYNEYLVKQTGVLYLKLPLKLATKTKNMFFIIFGKIRLLILNLFISEYLDQIPTWKEMKDAFSVKT